MWMGAVQERVVESQINDWMAASGKTLVRCVDETAVRRRAVGREVMVTPAFLAWAVFSETENREGTGKKTAHLFLGMWSWRCLWNNQVETSHQEFNILEFREKVWTRDTPVEGHGEFVIKAVGIDGSS